MKADITRQPLSFVLTQVLLLTCLFLTHFYKFPFDAIGITWSEQLISFQESIAEGLSIPGIVLDKFSVGHPLIAITIAILLLLLNGFRLIKLISRNLVYPARSYMPAVFYITLSCGIFLIPLSLAASVSAYLITSATVSFINSFRRSDTFGLTFAGAFLLGTAILIFPANMIYVMILPVAMILFRRSSREGIVSAIGLFIPFLTYGYISWALGGNFLDIFRMIYHSYSYIPFAISFAGINFDIYTISLLCTLSATFILLVLSIFSLGTMMSDMRTRAYKILSFMLWFLLITICGYLLPGRSPGMLAVTAIPLTIILPAFFVRHTGKLAAAIYIFYVMAFIWLNLYQFIL